MPKITNFSRLFCFALFLSSIVAVGQESIGGKKNEAAFLLGAEIIPQRSPTSGASLNFSKSVAYSATYSRYLLGGNTALYLEFPFAAATHHDVTSSDPTFVQNVATLFVTPGLRVNFANRSQFSPWLSGGYGYGLYEGSKILSNGQPNHYIYVNSGTAQFGGGIDWRSPLHIILPIGFRAEARDFYTVASPRYGEPVTGSGQNNVVVSGGLLIHF